MFKKSFDVLQKCFREMLAQYWEMRKRSGVQSVMHKTFGSLPAEFVQRRQFILDKYSYAFLKERKPFQEISQSDYEAEFAEAMNIFSAIESREDFKVFLDIFAWMPAGVYTLIFQELLKNDQRRDHLRQLLNDTPLVGEKSPDGERTFDMDEGYVLSARHSSELFNKLEIVLFQMPTVNEQGVTSLPQVRLEKMRKGLAVQILEDNLPR